MDIYKLNGVMRVSALVTEAVLDQLERDLKNACPLEDIVLERDPDMLEIKLICEASYGSAHKLDEVVRRFARQYAVDSSLFDSDYGGEKDELPMLSSADIGDIDALFDDSDEAGDAAEKLGKECTYLGDGIWLTGGQQMDRDDMISLLIRGREDEIRKDVSAESGFIPRAPVASSPELACE